MTTPLEAVRIAMEHMPGQRDFDHIIVTGALRMAEDALSEQEDLRHATAAHHTQELSFWTTMADDLYRLLKEASRSIDKTSSLWPEVAHYLAKYEKIVDPPMTDDEIEELADEFLEQARLAGEAIRESHGLPKFNGVSATPELRKELIKAIREANL